MQQRAELEGDLWGNGHVTALEGALSLDSQRLSRAGQRASSASGELSLGARAHLRFVSYFWAGVPLCIPGWPRTHYAVQATHLSLASACTHRGAPQRLPCVRRAVPGHGTSGCGGLGGRGSRRQRHLSQQGGGLCPCAHAPPHVGLLQ